MTKKQLQRRYDFLLLQLKIINQVAESFMSDKSDNNITEIVSTALHYTNATTIKNNIEFIEEFDESYNFYNKTMNIDDYTF